MRKPLSASTSGNLTADALMDLARQWAKRGPECVAIFEWELAPRDQGLQFFAPLSEQVQRALLGPYAPDVREALDGARTGDFVFIVNPVSLRLAFPSGVPKVQEPSGLFGIPVRELRRREEDAAAYGLWSEPAEVMWQRFQDRLDQRFSQDDAGQREALSLPRPLVEQPTYGEPLAETLQRIQDELHQAYRAARGETAAETAEAKRLDAASFAEECSAEVRANASERAAPNA